MQRLLILAVFTILVSSCDAVSPFPSCPLNDTYDYLSCAQPAFNSFAELEAEVVDERLQEISEAMNILCEEDAAEWLRSLDGSIRTVVPRVRETITDALEANDANLEESEFVYYGKRMSSLRNQDLYRSTLAIFLEAPLPTAMGNLGIAENRKPFTSSCVSYFEHLRDGRLTEILEEYMAEYFIGF